ncbi:MAG: enoyl-CoA hydratase/isomerase family protein, partial [Caldimonas sp.]
CDLRVASCEARLALPEIGLGLLPAGGGTQRLTALVGPSVARRLILGGEDIDGVEAQRLGVVQWVVPGPELAAWSAQLAARLGRNPRAAFAASKRCVALAEGGFAAGFAEEIAATRALYADPRTLERVSAFLNRPKPGR